ncbi:PLP-dependent transferase [Paraphaeosphaeria sporulosa]|uniref:PLP-dependent transferase n=1 Tax=Paraphaeosphaeria sporulosa TaxID=1460663 RepID=A0A177CV61_9PLEO|nr:PLP-dependent transferase [Paraphaeosphaeria sporulosa]OAG11413.1 PLP-dependent transferase [Paraphaeosphaeria sporulosa]
MLHGITYLDHAGTALPSVSLIDSFSRQQKRLLLANPHSALSTSPNLTQTVVQGARLQVLKLFNASPDHFDVVFVANATAATKLVFDAFRDQNQGFDYYYHRDCHTSLVGGRQLAQQHCCFSGADADDITEWWLGQDDAQNDHARPKLFAYPAQSNMNGRRLPLSWPATMRKEGRHKNTYVLLDVAAYVSTSPLDLSDHEGAPDFLTMSFYKIFGYPNLGALLVRKAAAHVFNQRRYFGGGTTDMITCNEDTWVARKKGLSESVEDGTGPAHSILALDCAIRVHQKLYGGLEQVSKHTSWLARQLYEQLSSLRHSNGRLVCVIYKDPASTYGDRTTQGATVAFNVYGTDGRYFDTALVSNEAMACKIHIRAGSLCNPAGMAHTLGYDDHELRRVYSAGLRCGEGNSFTGRPLGMVRVSFGACSILDDVVAFMNFMKASFVDRTSDRHDSKTQTVDKQGMKMLAVERRRSRVGIGEAG